MKKLIYFFLFFCAVPHLKAQNRDSLKAYPNPFSQQLSIHFQLEEEDSITLKAIDMIGRVRASFFSNTKLPIGSYTVIWDADTVEKGVYLVFYNTKQDSVSKLKVVKAEESTGVNNSQMKQPILYPNPTNGLVYIPLAGANEVSIRTIEGKLVKTLLLDGDRLDLNELATGVYSIEIKDVKHQTIQTQKVIKLEQQ